jgi:F-type H+-transporting ATPase subunit a
MLSFADLFAMCIKSCFSYTVSLSLLISFERVDAEYVLFSFEGAMFCIYDFTVLFTVIFCSFLCGNVIGLFDFSTFSMFLLIVILLSIVILRLCDYVLSVNYTFKSVLLLSIDLGYSSVIVTIFLFLIEIVSNMFRSLSLGFRLFANLFAGHLIIVMLVSISCYYIFTCMLVSYLVISLVIVGIFSIEIFMAIVQSYVFSSLVRIYFIDLV